MSDPREVLARLFASHSAGPHTYANAFMLALRVNGLAVVPVAPIERYRNIQKRAFKDQRGTPIELIGEYEDAKNDLAEAMLAAARQGQSEGVG